MCFVFMNAPTALPRPHATLYPLVPRPGPRPGFSSALGLVPWFFEPPNPTALNQMDKLPTFTQARSSLIPNLNNPNPNPNPNLNSNPNDLTTSTQSVTNTTFTAPRPAACPWSTSAPPVALLRAQQGNPNPFEPQPQP